ncbi:MULTISPECIES: acetylornithine deacetylase [unclassified Staphylococcus]|uniref:acetylornithine deacetylase n=1 Tax=unclassified Staphylococcus TaxID=91994 RepID=UPI0021D39ABA|nr:MULTISPECIES: acetylornithine deacetylase [unclassified Staphylococcus]UXR77797.1 acetylornithine deacetylase [Staphylococcus sp. IVB6227]UXR81956.1 acetylornithine deacetylase [Staphylococcus sp. IVB6214]
MNERHIDILRTLIAHPTISPPARNTATLQRVITNWLTSIGFDVNQIPFYDNDIILVATLKGRDDNAPKLILNGHIDVAEVDDTRFWQTDPFELVIKDGYLYGRGVADMKGGVSSLIYTLEKLHKEGKQPEGDIIVQIVAGEEVGEAGTKVACEHSPQADLALVLDTSESIAMGQGGVITGWITIQSDETIHDGARSHMIHAGGGRHGASAIEKMMKIIQALQELERHWAVTKSYPGMPAGANTINPAVIQGGRHPAFIADKCELWITIHYLPNEDYETITQEIEDYLNRVASSDLWLQHHPLQYRWGGTSMIEDQGEIFPSFTLPEKHPGFELLQEAHQTVHQQPLQTTMSTTVTDGGWTAHFGIPTILYGPGELNEAHGTNEKINQLDLEQFTEVLYQFLTKWYKQPQANTIS